MVQKGIGLDLHHYERTITRQADRLNTPHWTVRLTLARSERRKVMLSHQILRPLLHRFNIQRCAHPGRARLQKSRADAIDVGVIAVGTSTRREASMKLSRHFARPVHSDRSWQLSIGAFNPSLFIAICCAIKMHYLINRMDPRIGSPGADERHRM